MGIACSVCRSSDHVTLEDKNLSLYKCGKCTHGFKSIAKDMQERYNEPYFSETHKNWFNNPFYSHYKFINNEISKRIRHRRVSVLDIGCGTGTFLKYLRSRNPEYKLCGMDLAENQLDGIKFIKGDILKDNIDMKFDIVCGLLMLEHLDLPYLFAERIKDILQPGGYLFLTTVNEDDLIYKIIRLLKKAGLSSGYRRIYSTHHLQLFTKKSLKTLMEMNDYEVALQKAHNYPLKSVDFPKASAITTMLYKFSVAAVFMVSGVLKEGLLQTIICRKKKL